MKRFVLPFLLLIVLMALTVKQATPSRTLALYDHPTVQESAGAEFTAFEASVRSTRSYVVPVDVDARQTDLANEGRIVTERDIRRWHRSQTARRML